MSKNVTINGINYSGVSQVQLNTTDGVTALFQDVDEIGSSGGNDGIETGTIVGTGVTFANTESNLTDSNSDKRGLVIPVLSLKTHFMIWLDGYNGETATELGEHAVVSSMYCVENGYFIGHGVRVNSTPSSGIYGSGTLVADDGKKAIFTDTYILIKNGIAVAQEMLANGKTYRWMAW